MSTDRQENIQVHEGSTDANVFINVKTLIKYFYFLKVINIKKEKLFPKIFRFRKNRNLVENSFWEKLIKNLKNTFYNCIMLTFLRLAFIRELLKSWRLATEIVNNYQSLFSTMHRSTLVKLSTRRWKKTNIQQSLYLLILWNGTTQRW